jgi:hypothetical protein
MLQHSPPDTTPASSFLITHNLLHHATATIVFFQYDSCTHSDLFGSTERQLSLESFSLKRSHTFDTITFTTMRVSFLTKITVLLLIHVIASENSLSNDKHEMDEKVSLCVYTKHAEWPASYQSQKLSPRKADAKLRHDLAFICNDSLTVNDYPGNWPCCSCGAPCLDNLTDANCGCVPQGTFANTKYPVVFAPSRMALPSVIDPTVRFGGLLEYLHAMGNASVYNTTTDQCESLPNCAANFKRQFLQILAITGKTKGNIIAHLEAGLYVRYAITNLGLASKVSSVTTINTPHRGTPLFDYEGMGKSIAQYFQQKYAQRCWCVLSVFLQHCSSFLDALNQEISFGSHWRKRYTQ